MTNYRRILEMHSQGHSQRSEYFMLRKALNRTKESTISLHGKHQRATRKALAIQIINCA